MFLAHRHQQCSKESTGRRRERCDDQYFHNQDGQRIIWLHAPVKAALDSSLAFLVKSFSRFSKIRFNAVGAGLLKTSASAGIPGYVDSYLYAEKVIPRHEALQTDEVANVAVFLLSPRSSGVTAQTIVVDAGMAINYFDQSIVKHASHM